MWLVGGQWGWGFPEVEEYHPEPPHSGVCVLMWACYRDVCVCMCVFQCVYASVYVSYCVCVCVRMGVYVSILPPALTRRFWGPVLCTHVLLEFY